MNLNEYPSSEDDTSSPPPSLPTNTLIVQPAPHIPNTIPYTPSVQPNPHNPNYHPLQTKTDPNSLGRALVETHQMDGTLFDLSYYKHMSSPSSSSDVKTKTKRKRTRKGMYRAPWDEIELEEDFQQDIDIQPAEEFIPKEKEKIITENLSKQIKVPDGQIFDLENSKKMSFRESSTFHGTEFLDYQGKSYMHPPSGLSAPSRRCYLPKRCIHTWKGHSKAVTRIRFFPQYGHLLLSSSMDCSVKLWDVHRERKCLRTFSGHSEQVSDISFNENGSQFLSVSADKSVKLWDTETGQCVSRFVHFRAPRVAVFVPGSTDQFISAGADKSILQWDLRNSQKNTDSEICKVSEISEKPKMTYKQHLGAVNSLTFLADGRRFVSTSDDKKILVWELGNPVPVKHIAEAHLQSMPAVSLHPSGNFIATQSMDNTLLVYQCRDKSVKQEKDKIFSGHKNSGYACQIGFSPDGRFLVSGDAEGGCYFWDWKKTSLLSRLDAHKKVTIGVAWHPLESSRVATCSWDGLIRYWD